MRQNPLELRIVSILLQRPQAKNDIQNSIRVNCDNDLQTEKMYNQKMYHVI